jgi:3-oxocholest-4-en-26-oate---CoA ligase
MGGWNFAELWERIADKFPDATAQVQGDRRLSWREFDQRADGLARALLGAGALHEDKVAIYLYNGPEYLETTFACFKAGLVPVNTNYRYVADELVYLWDNADAVAVVFHGTFTSVVDPIRGQLPKVRTWLWVDDGDGECPPWAVPYESVVDAAAERVVGSKPRDGDDILMIYTGGTTGMPKGVMWRQDDLIRATCATGLPILLQDPEEVGGHDTVIEQIAAPGLPGLPACPLMHGTGWFTANIYLTQAGSVVSLVDRKFNVIELLDTIEREGVGALTIVGDAFAKPIVRALDSEPGRWDLSSLVLISSSGVMWSEPVKEALLRHHPGMFLVDAFSSSEAIGLGQSMSAAGNEARTARFSLGTSARVISEDGHDVVPGSGEKGRVAVRGHTPIGYYKDPEKSAATFLTIDGARYSMPGDWATVEPDGTINLLGRGSVCINTGGEKVFPEEVEEVLKEFPTVYDAVVVGVPDDKFGEAITAVVELKPGETLVEADLIDHVKAHLAAFKAPKRVLAVETIGRGANGKVDYARWKGYALDSLGVT